jgi:polysaccharide export outer membrane protein
VGEDRPQSWVPRSGGALSPVIQPGDRVNITMWQSEDNSLLSIPSQKRVDIGEMVVSAGGTVFLPYVEEVRIAGMTPDAARRALQAALVQIVPTAQVQLAMVSGRQNSVDIVSGVRNPGSYPLPDRNTSVLSALSLAGGVAPELRNPQLRLIRGGDVYGTPLAALYDTPSLDTTLRGGDKLVLEADGRHFLALGATGREEIVYFPKEEVSVLDATALMGGMNDARANLKGVLILRRYPVTAVQPDPVGPANAQVVFTVDLTTADGLFSAGAFHVLPGDVVLATESPVTAMQTIFALVGSALRISNQVN